MGCNISTGLVIVYMDGVRKEVKEGSELPGGRERVDIT